ncbi:F-box/FBD/LRR-repeat protein At1g13570-like [Solanum tuberosum]|uniref:Ubiquitin-protein ligase n=1 Tax=Solanum tuberosum TaxID=4113 RepID=M1B2T7_SOLTU|nr:PREDICTED: F-box/FBD/LRR-repeat protein At1g13570-like [Solanum tuberosum]
MKSATISNLPCNVLDKILGSLPLKDAVKTSILSKGWRYKWVTRAELDFRSEFFTSFNDNQEAKKIIYQVLRLHQGPILKFTLQHPNLICYRDIYNWMLFLSKKNVQELTLQIFTGNKYHLPSYLFTFQQLRHLDLDMCFFHPPPDFKGFAKLISINLQHVIFDPTIFRNLITKCPLLESLMLTRCTAFDVLEIDAPNLKCFDFLGTSKFICFKNVPMLKTVAVCLNQILMDTSTFCSNLTKFFHFMPSLEELELGGSSLEYLNMGGIPENPPAALNNVKSLCISDMSFRSVEEVSSAVYLITSCPKLQELTIECEAVGIVVEPVIQFLRAKAISCGAMKLLKSVEMRYFIGFEMEIEFVKFILASAPVLKEIFIWSSGQFHRGTQMMDEIKQFHRESPNVRFKFEEM